MIRDAMKLTRKGGSICVLGLYHGAEPAVIDPMDFIVREQTIRGNFGSPGLWPDVIAMVQAGSVNPRPLITHRFPLSRAKEAFEATLDELQRPVRIVLHP